MPRSRSHRRRHRPLARAVLDAFRRPATATALWLSLVVTTIGFIAIEVRALSTFAVADDSVPARQQHPPAVGCDAIVRLSQGAVRVLRWEDGRHGDATAEACHAR